MLNNIKIWHIVVNLYILKIIKTKVNSPCLYYTYIELSSSVQNSNINFFDFNVMDYEYT